MWTALGLYAFGPNHRDLREYKKLRRRRKKKGDRSVIIPEEAFSVDEEYLPHLEEIRIQDEPQTLQDSSSVSYESEYTKFKYSMGGNIKLYDDHIALTSPRKKLIKTPKRSYKILDETMHSSLNSSPARSALSGTFGSMDMTPRILNASVKKELQLNETSSQDRLPEKTTESKVENEELDSSSQIRAALERLKLADSTGTAQVSKSNTASSSIADSIAKVDSWKTDFDNCNSPSHVVEDIKDSRVQDANYASTVSNSTLQTQQREKTSSGNGARARDYSPIRSTPASVPISNLKDDIKSSIDPSIYSLGPQRPEGQTKNEPEAKTNDVYCRIETVNMNYEPKVGEIQDPERMNRYNRTLLYVSEQNETLQNGDYNELNIDLSDLSSDVFTDSEIPTSGFLSQSRDGKSDLDFYPDSPTTEQAFSKTPCSSRKNSLESYMSDDSMSVTDMDINTPGQKKINKLIPNGAIHSNSHVKQNGKEKQTQQTKIKPLDAKAKIGSTQKLNNKPDGVKIETKKIDFNKRAKPKVDSFGNIKHVPGGGRVKVQTDKVSQTRRVEPRTDTHGVQAYSHLPSEFQEIAKRLAKQDRQLRNSKISGSSSSGRSRPRSRRSSHGSSGAGSLSPDRRSSSKPNFRFGRLPGSSVNLNSPTASLGPNKASRRASISRSPSIRSRPTTPSLSRSHPATYVTPYDSRSRPSSRPSSRPNSRSSSPVRSRNTSPTSGRRTTGPSPAPNYRKASTLSRTSPSSNRSKTRMSNGMGGRPTTLNGLTSMEIGLASGSVFQVIPVHK